MNGTNLITIDGPAASGKSSVSRMVAHELGWPWVSTGAFYRGLALATMEQDLDPMDEAGVVALAEAKTWSVEMRPGDTGVFINGADKTEQIAGEEVGGLASRLSQSQGVRKALLQRQRDCYDPLRGLVAEGRDCGTVLFPQAITKVYLTANASLRAKRRREQQGQNQEETEALQKVRDKQDSERKFAPMRVADGALTIDSSYLSLEEVVAEVIKYYKSLLA